MEDEEPVLQAKSRDNLRWKTPNVRMLWLLSMLMFVTLCLVADVSRASEHYVAHVGVLRVSQPPYQPVAVRVEVKGTVGHEMSALIKIWDAQGHAVYYPSHEGPSWVTYTQRYFDAAITIRWSKRGLDGIPVPRGRSYVVKAATGDLNARTSGLQWSRPFSFVLR
jgi:hypothetical protein